MKKKVNISLKKVLLVGLTSIKATGTLNGQSKKN
jgi:hypothetical protein